MKCLLFHRVLQYPSEVPTFTLVFEVPTLTQACEACKWSAYYYTCLCSIQVKCLLSLFFVQYPCEVPTLRQAYAESEWNAYAYTSVCSISFKCIPLHRLTQNLREVPFSYTYLCSIRVKCILLHFFVKHPCEVPTLTHDYEESAWSA